MQVLASSGQDMGALRGYNPLLGDTLSPFAVLPLWLALGLGRFGGFGGGVHDHALGLGGCVGLLCDLSEREATSMHDLCLALLACESLPLGTEGYGRVWVDQDWGDKIGVFGSFARNAFGYLWILVLFCAKGAGPMHWAFHPLGVAYSEHL